MPVSVSGHEKAKPPAKHGRPKNDLEAYTIHLKQCPGESLLHAVGPGGAQILVKMKSPQPVQL